ncbi:MAG: hypothetical protein JWP18_165 [Solirubrobacterales bacterium]|nr:hypothetical protein [Solirubrobacterales bacterium]
MAAFQQVPLIGPGSELQLTLDGRAVPHVEVVRARAAVPTPGVAAEAPAGLAEDASVPEGQTSL